MKMPHNSMQMWNMALTGIIPLSLSESLSLSLSLSDVACAENLPISFVCHDTSK